MSRSSSERAPVIGHAPLRTRGGGLRRTGGLVLVAGAALIAAASPASAQILADPLVPGGRVRLDFAPSYTRWDSRFGLRFEEGALVDVDEPLGTDLTDSDGSSLFPGIADLRESIQALAGQAGFQTHLGSTSGTVTQEITRIDAGLRIGVFDWLTLGVTVPYVKTRAAVDVAFVPAEGANLGLNPYRTDPGAVSALLMGLDDAAAAADAHASSVCAGGAGAACDAAQALADRAGVFLQHTRTAYLSSPFFPVATDPIAADLEAALAALNGALASASLPGVAASMAFAAEAFTSADFAELPGDPAIDGAPLQTIDGLWTLGDVELTGSVRLLEGEVRDSGAVSPRFAWMLSGGALVRLGTGVVDDPAIAFDQGSGDGQMDIEGHVDAALRIGAHLDLRGSVRYGVQQSGQLVRRVARHERVFPPAHTARVVEWTPGEYQSVLISPRWHVGEALAVSVDLWRYHKDADRYEILGVQPEGLPPVTHQDLEHESAMTLYQVGFGFRYSTIALARRGQSDTPVELGARLVRAVSGTGGRAPKSTRMELSVSLFRRIWGS